MDPFKTFRQRIARRLAELATQAEREFRTVEAGHARSGAGGATIKAMASAIADQMNVATDWALSETDRLPYQKIMKRELMAPYLDDALHQHLRELTERANWGRILEMAARASPASRAAAEQLHGQICLTLEGELLDFAAGIWAPRGAPRSGAIVHHTAYNQTVHGDVNGVVQQAGPGSSQTALITQPPQEISRALADLRSAIESVALATDVRADLEIDLAAIDAQLKKSRPDVAIMRAAGSAIRDVAIGIAAGVLTPPVQALLQSLGVG